MTPGKIRSRGKIPNVKPISKRPCRLLSGMALTFGIGQPERIFPWGRSSTTLLVFKGTPVSLGWWMVGGRRVEYLASPDPVALVRTP